MSVQALYQKFWNFNKKQHLSSLEKKIQRLELAQREKYLKKLQRNLKFYRSLTGKLLYLLWVLLINVVVVFLLLYVLLVIGLMLLLEFASLFEEFNLDFTNILDLAWLLLYGGRFHLLFFGFSTTVYVIFFAQPVQMAAVSEVCEKYRVESQAAV